jgi:ABC-type cobalamin transport system permease subunit
LAASADLPIGIGTVAIGAPVFLWSVLRQQELGGR